jgi:hypothetical protein
VCGSRPTRMIRSYGRTCRFMSCTARRDRRPRSHAAAG